MTAIAYYRPNKFQHKELNLGKYCYIQGMWKALVVEQQKEFVRCIPLDFYKEMKKVNKKAKRKDFVYTFTPSLIYETATQI